MVALFITVADVIEGYGIAFVTAIIAVYALYRLEKQRDQLPLELD